MFLFDNGKWLKNFIFSMMFFFGVTLCYETFLTHNILDRNLYGVFPAACRTAILFMTVVLSVISLRKIVREASCLPNGRRVKILFILSSAFLILTSIFIYSRNGRYLFFAQFEFDWYRENTVQINLVNVVISVVISLFWILYRLSIKTLLEVAFPLIVRFVLVKDAVSRRINRVFLVILSIVIVRFVSLIMSFYQSGGFSESGNGTVLAFSLFLPFSSAMFAYKSMGIFGVFSFLNDLFFYIFIAIVCNGILGLKFQEKIIVNKTEREEYLSV